MRHCIFRSYFSRIGAGEYIAWHITGPGCGSSGATCGLSLFREENVVYRTRGEIFRSRRKINQQKTWRHDQTRGKGNSIPDLQKLSPFIEEIVHQCNALASAPKTEKKKYND